MLDSWWLTKARLRQRSLNKPVVMHVTRCCPRPHQNIRPKISGTPLNLISSHLRCFPPINNRRALYISSEPLISVGAPKKANSCFRRRPAAPWTQIATRLAFSPWAWPTDLFMALPSDLPPANTRRPHFSNSEMIQPPTGPSGPI